MSLVKLTDADGNDKKVAITNESTRPKRYMKVLDEESFISVKKYLLNFLLKLSNLIYQKKLETIIEKSFFPDLERLKVQKAYQEALKANNIDALRELYSKYQNLLTPSTRTSSTCIKLN